MFDNEPMATRLWMRVVISAQLLIFVSGMKTELEILEELAAMYSVKGTGNDLFMEVSACLERLELKWEKLDFVQI